MRSKYKNKFSVAQAKNDKKMVDEYSKDLSNIEQPKLLSPEIQIKKHPIFIGYKDKKSNCNNNKTINKQNALNKNSKINFILKQNKINDNKSNNILTVSYELNNKKNNNNSISTGKNYTNKYYLKVNKENKENKNNGNLKINKEKDILIDNINFTKINNNIIKNKSQNKNNENTNKIIISKVNINKSSSIKNINNNNNSYSKFDYINLNKEKNIVDNADNANSINNINELYHSKNIIVKKRIDNTNKNNDLQNTSKYTKNKDFFNDNQRYFKEKNASISVDTKNSIHSKDSLKNLIHKAHKIKELTESFNKNYVPNKINQYKKTTYDPHAEQYSLSKNILDKYNLVNTKLKENDTNNRNVSEIIDIKHSVNLNIIKTETISENDKKFNYITNINDNKEEIKVNKGVVNLSNTDEIKIKKRGKTKSSNEVVIKNNNESNINEDINNSTLNRNKVEHGKALSEKKYIFNKNWSFLNILPHNYLIKNDNNINNNNNKYNIRNKNYNVTFVDSIPNNSNNYDINDFYEMIYNFEIKYKNIITKIKNFQKCIDECLDWITYYFNNNLFYKITNIFKSKINKYTISNYFKIEILSIFLCYNISFNKTFSEVNKNFILLINLLHNNFLILLIYIVNNHKDNNKSDNIFLNNDIILNKINKLIISEEYSKSYYNKIKSEAKVLSLITDNFREIKNYFYNIIDYIYLSIYNSILEDTNFINSLTNGDNNISVFPFSLKIEKNKLKNNQKIGLISLFFYDSFKNLNIYNFEDLLIFFEKFLLETNDINIYNYYKINNKIYIDNNNNNNNQFRDFSSNMNNGPSQYFLPPIKKCYKYTLVLDLDETLIFCRKDKNKNNRKNNNNIYNNSLVNTKTLIMRPGLLEFLHKMKQIYELVLFSLGTSDYVNKIVNIIEEKEKFFEYILYRHHAIYSDNVYIKNLSLLGRDLKNIIIVDDVPQVFKLHKNNGICIKPFYGDIMRDKNTLKVLGNILQKIRFDADELGDIRKSLKLHKDLIFSHITT